MQRAGAPQRIIGPDSADYLPYGASALNCLLNSIRLMASLSPVCSNADGIFGGFIYAGSITNAGDETFSQGIQYLEETLLSPDLAAFWEVRAISSISALRTFVEERASGDFALLDLRGTALCWIAESGSHTGPEGHSFVIETHDHGALTVADPSVFGIGKVFSVTYESYESAFRGDSFDVSIFNWRAASKILASLPIEVRMRRRVRQGRARLRSLRIALASLQMATNTNNSNQDRARQLQRMVCTVALSLSDQQFWWQLELDTADLLQKIRKVALALQLARIANANFPTDTEDGRLSRRIEDASSVLKMVIEEFDRRLLKS